MLTAALMKVRDEIIGENHSKAASDENGTEHDIAETDKEEIKKEAIGKEQIGEDDIEKTELQPVLYMDQETYRSLVKKVWIEDWPERQYSDAFEFIITRIEAEKIEGVIVFGDDVASCYWSNIKKLQQRCRPFQGTIHGNQSV